MTESMPIAFDQAALAEWIEACRDEAAARADGAPIGELTAARTGVVAGLVSLIAPSMNPEVAFALFSLLLEAPAEVPVEEEGDPIPDEDPIADEQTDAGDVESSSEDEVEG